MKTVLDLEEAGYILTVEGDSIRCELAPGRSVDETLAYVLMDELQEHEQEVLTFLRQRQVAAGNPLSTTLAEFYRKVSCQLAQAYRPGCIAWVEKYRPDLQQQIDLAESKVNQAWLDCEAGAGSVDAVKAALTDWYKAHRAAILEYNLKGA